MKKLYFSSVLLFVSLCFNSCSVIGGIFKAGAVVGVLAVIIIIAIIIWIISMFRGKS